MLKPDFADVYINRAVALEADGRLSEAIASVRRGIALKPDQAEAHFNLALFLLKSGDLLSGWGELEWRWRAKSGPIYREKRVFREPLWLGKEDLAGKTILLYAEQGLGDALQFCRYVEQVAALGARVILEVPEPLVGICGSLQGVSQVVAFESSLPPFDVQCPLMSLPLAFRTTLESIPAQPRYLRSDGGKVEQWQQRLGAPTKPRVGLTWSGKRAPGTNRERHFPWRCCFRIFPIPVSTFVCRPTFARKMPRHWRRTRRFNTLRKTCRVFPAPRRCVNVWT